jgi:hypothetical protein
MISDLVKSNAALSTVFCTIQVMKFFRMKYKKIKKVLAGIL